MTEREMKILEIIKIFRTLNDEKKADVLNFVKQQSEYNSEHCQFLQTEKNAE